MRIKRRDFLFTAAGASGVALVVGATGSPSPEAFAQSFGQASLPPPEDSGIEHIVVVMMENRSFDQDRKSVV